MSTMILCKSKKAQIPYVFRPEGTGVYTMEELCYYLYKNIYFLNKDMIGQSLFSWIENSLHLSKLAYMLRQKAIEKESVFSIAVTILQHSDLYTEEEIVHAKELIHNLEDKTEIERRLICADEMLLKKNYRQALYYYLDLIHEDNDAFMTEETKASIYEHAAYIYTKMNCFPEAITMHKASYEITKSFETKQHIYYLVQIAKKWGQKVDLPQTFFMKHEIEELHNSYEISSLQMK